MDVQTGLIYVAVVVVSALVIGFVSIFAMKEKSYEEAIAEQRKLPDDLLLGKKDKGKEKKHKNKTGKKVKEKKEEKEEKEEKVEHVQFEENPQILPPEPLQELGKVNKKKGKAEKVKPILVNKDEPVVVVTEPSPSQPLPSQETNHFDVIQPKDDLELIRSHSRENLHQLSQSELAVNKSPKDTPTKVNKKNVNKEKESKKKEEHKEEKKETSTSVNQQQQQNKEKEVKESKEKERQPKEVVTSVKESKDAKELKENASIKETVVPIQTTNKESKKVKKKNDILAQIGGDADGINFSLLRPLVQKAELSRSEIQFMIELLLNKQQENPAGEQAEWSEGRADPVLKLKKQLADKEKALKDEQEASASVQSKLLELRAELNSERSRLTAQVRHLDEALAGKLAEVQTLHTRMQHILESHAAEKQGFARQIEQLQTKVNEDAAIIVKMQEDQGQSHGQMQQELCAQRKQLEMHAAQMRDAEAALKTQLAQRLAEYQELQALNVSLQQELQATCESSAHELDLLSQQLTHAQESLVHAEAQLQHYKEAADRLPAVHRELDEARRAHAELDHRLTTAHRREQDLRQQLSRVQAELEKSAAEARRSAELEAELARTREQLAKAVEDSRRLAEVHEINERLSKELGAVKEKNEALSAQLLAAAERPAIEGRENGIEEKTQKSSVHNDESSNLLTQKEEQISALRVALSQKEKELDQLSMQVEALRSEVNSQHSATARLQDELEEQRSKNNDDVEQIKVDEQEATKALLQRIFPEIKVAEKSHDRWMKVFEEQVHIAVNKLKTDAKSDDGSEELEQTNKNLQSMVNHYKQIIYDTEGMLNKLQSHIESEEKRWQIQLRQKDNELSNLRIEIVDLQKQSSLNAELQVKVTELESRLSECKVSKNESQVLESTHSQTLAHDLIAVEKLQEEKVQLLEKLQNESSKREGLNSELAKLHSLVEKSETNLAQEKKLVSQLQNEITQLKSATFGGSSSSGQCTVNGPPVTDSSKSEPTLGAQCPIAALEKTPLKSNDLENCSLSESNVMVHSEQDFDDESLSSKITSNSCEITDKVAQKSCNPLNGQQQKKHKKKRKGGLGKK